MCNLESLMGWSAITHKGCLFCFVGIQNEQKHYLSVVTQIMSLQKPYEHNANMTLENIATRFMCSFKVSTYSFVHPECSIPRFLTPEIVISTLT